MRMLLKILIAAAFLPLMCAGARELELSNGAAKKIGRQIWKNEAGGTIPGLTSWNSGEDFASLGIGHFIWYPPGKEGPFEESWPKLARFLKANGSGVPDWMLRDCPWSTKQEFERAQSSPRMKELRGLLSSTIPQQTQFLIQRLRKALPKMLAAAPPGERRELERKFDAVASTPAGVYALIDYVNFKGEGTRETERYRGLGWGLLQVLQEMQLRGEGAPAVKEFSAAAERVLRRRVRNSPPQRNEQRWLKGWSNRVRAYPRF